MSQQAADDKAMVTTTAQAIVLRRLGRCEYQRSWQAMREFTDARSASTPDEFWLVEHPAVFTLGQAGRVEHILNAAQIPVVNSDRGGQVTYHGPGQLVLYTLVNLRRLRIGVRSMVAAIESAVIASLHTQGLNAQRREGAPGVYVDGAKIAALGLRVRNACTYHGVALNVNLELEPFTRINPCGFEGLQVTSLAELGIQSDVDVQGPLLARALANCLHSELIEMQA